MDTMLQSILDYGVLGLVVAALVVVVKYQLKINKECQDTITNKLFDVVENNTKASIKLQESIQNISLKVANMK